MKTNKENMMKEKFVTMCSELDMYENRMFFDFDEFESINEISQSSDYPELKTKMEKMVSLINSDPSLLEKDIEDELWYMV